MLSDLEVGQFWTFGFTVLRGCLSEKEVERLQEAHSRVIVDAPVYNYFAENETRMLGPFVQADDAFADLIEQPGVMEAMRDIWGTECLYIAGSDMWANRDDTPWHTDGQPGRHILTLKTAIYLDEQSKDFGSLNLIPGSHHPEYSAALFRSCGYWIGGDPAYASIPMQFRESSPCRPVPETLCCGTIACGTPPSSARTVIPDGRCLSAICRTPKRSTCHQRPSDDGGSPYN